MVSYHTEVANARNIGYDGRRKGAEPLYWVYVLVCRDGSLYTGMTNDLRRRMALHMTGKGAKYTRAHPPQALAGLWRCGGKTGGGPAGIRRQDPAGGRGSWRCWPRRSR